MAPVGLRAAVVCKPLFSCVAARSPQRFLTSFLRRWKRRHQADSSLSGVSLGPGCLPVNATSDATVTLAAHSVFSASSVGIVHSKPKGFLLSHRP
jgi:hypothetical protein